MIRLCLLVTLFANAAAAPFANAAAAQQDVVRNVEGNRTTENVPPISASLVDRVGRYADVRSAYMLDWQPDGKALLITTRFADTNQLHRVTSPLGQREQLTFFAEPVSAGGFAEDGNAILFGRDAGGNENYQVFRMQLDGGALTPLTPAGARSSTGVWSNDRKRIAYMSNRDDPARFDVWVGSNSEPDDARMLVKGTGFYWSPAAWSLDDSKLIVQQTISAAESKLFITDVASGETVRVCDSPRKVSFGESAFSADAKTIYTTSDDGAEFTRLVRIDPTKCEPTVLTGDIMWDVVSMAMSPDHKALAFATNEDGISRLHLLDTKNDKYRLVQEVPEGLVYRLAFSPSGDRLAMTLDRSTAPADVYVYHVKKRKLERWTISETAGLSVDDFVEPELVHFPSFDGLMIPAFVYRPGSATGKLPVIVSIHGGPEGQSRPGFSARTQYLVNELGAVVIVPNVRGSTGYGKSYLDLDNATKREDTVRDIGALLDWVATQNDLDQDRVGVIGGSYGGYMVLGTMTLYNDRIKAGVEYYGISNFVTFLENTSDYRRDHRRQEYGDERDPVIREYLNRTAPMNNVHKITKPLFVLQGTNDPRVPQSESEQIVAKVRGNGGVVWYLLFDDEGHGFRKKANQAYSDAAVIKFFEQNL